MSERVSTDALIARFEEIIGLAMREGEDRFPPAWAGGSSVNTPAAINWYDRRERRTEDFRAARDEFVQQLRATLDSAPAPTPRPAHEEG